MRPDYEISLVRHAHEIVALGYARLKPPSFAKSEEEDITGELTRAVRAALDEPTCPPWSKNFSIAEELPIHEPDRRGKRRRRIDIEITQNGLAPRPRFVFEAKRLHDAASRSVYLGSEGLGRFLGGTYAKSDRIAGMLGYVQAGNVDDHATALADKLKTDPRRYRVAKGQGWVEHTLVESLSTFRSKHNCNCLLPPITILHTLLPFC
jgi:hypothetical protein